MRTSMSSSAAAAEKEAQERLPWRRRRRRWPERRSEAAMAATGEAIGLGFSGVSVFDAVRELRFWTEEASFLEISDLKKPTLAQKGPIYISFDGLGGYSAS